MPFGFNGGLMAYTNTCTHKNSRQSSRNGVPTIMKKFSVAACGVFVLLCGLLPAQETQPAKPCPAEGFSGGFSHGCPQKRLANPSDISAMTAALPDKPPATPQSLHHVLVLCRANGWVHTSIPLAARLVES